MSTSLNRDSSFDRVTEEHLLVIGKDSQSVPGLSDAGVCIQGRDTACPQEASLSRRRVLIGRVEFSICEPVAEEEAVSQQ